MKKLIAVALVLVLALSLVACSSETNNTQGNKDVKIGVILVHDENTGYDEAHINGIKKALENCGIPNDTDHVVWKYNVPEDEKCHDAATELVEAGCTYIFSDSYGHQPYSAGRYRKSGRSVRLHDRRHRRPERTEELQERLLQHL